MNQTISNLAAELKAAVLGTPPKTIDPTIAAATVICELALPRVKNTLGEKFTQAKKLFQEIRQLQKVVSLPAEVLGNAAFEKQSAEHQSEAVSGNLHGVARGRSRQAWLDDFQARHDAANEAMRKHGAKLAPLQIEIADVILATLHDEVAELENVEARQAARFGIPFAASPTVNKLRSLADYLRNRGAITLLDEKL